MELAVRSRLAAGVVFAGVSTLVVNPVGPQLSELATLPTEASVPVALTSVVNPIVEYGEAFAVAFQNAVSLGDQIAANPAPILSQIIRNQLAAASGVGTFVSTFGNSVATALAETPQQVQTALDQLASGNVSGALNTLVNTALAPVVQAVVDTLLFHPEIWTGLQNAIRQPVANVLAVVDLLAVPQVYNLLGPLLAPVQVITDVTGAVGAAGDELVAGLQQGDVEKIANAVLGVGPAVTYALLNGTPISGDYAAGLLGPNGIVAGLLNIRDQIAGAITPPAVTGTLLKIESSPIATTLEVAPEATQELSSGGATAAEQGATPQPTAAEAPTQGAEPAAAEPVSDPTPTKVDEEPSSADATGNEADAPAADAGAVKDSPKAVPGKSGTDHAADDRPGAKLRGGVRGALKGLTNGLKEASDKLTGKPAKAEAGGGSAGGEKSESKDGGTE